MVLLYDLMKTRDRKRAWKRLVAQHFGIHALWAYTLTHELYGSGTRCFKSNKRVEQRSKWQKGGGRQQGMKAKKKKIEIKGKKRTVFN